MTTDHTTTHVVHSIPGASDITVERDHVYATERGPLGFDLYRPPHPVGPSPAVVIISGYPDPDPATARKPLKDWASYQDWARLLAASGLVAIAARNREPADAHVLVAHLRAHAAELGIDAARVGLWACSGHVPNALAVVARARPACAALLYGYTLDLDGATEVATAAAQFRFATPPVSIDDLPADVPMLVVRAGADAMPGLNVALDRSVAAARERSLAVTLLDLPESPHAFDLGDDTPATRAAIEHVLAFLRRGLGLEPRSRAG